jgi:hypothetical protein
MITFHSSWLHKIPFPLNILMDSHPPGKPGDEAASESLGGQKNFWEQEPTVMFEDISAK